MERGDTVHPTWNWSFIFRKNFRRILKRIYKGKVFKVSESEVINNWMENGEREKGDREGKVHSIRNWGIWLKNSAINCSSSSCQHIDDDDDILFHVNSRLTCSPSLTFFSLFYLVQVCCQFSRFRWVFNKNQQII